MATATSRRTTPRRWRARCVWGCVGVGGRTRGRIGRVSTTCSRRPRVGVALVRASGRASGAVGRHAPCGGRARVLATVLRSRHRRGRPECVLFLLCAAAVASCASGAAPLCGVGTEVIDTSASPPFSPCARATAPLPNPGLYKCRSTYIPPDSAGRGEAVCDADNNAACSRNCVEAYAEELRAQLVAAEEEGAAAAFHAEVSAGRGGHATHFWPLLFDVASGTIQANGRNISHEGDVAKGELSVGKTLAEWIMDITCENCTLSEETMESQRRGVVPIKGVPGAICREDADSPGAGFCVSEPELVNVTDAQSVAAAADGYLQRFRAALDACQSGAFVYVLMPSTLVGGHSAHLGGLHVDEWVFYASAPTPAGTVVAYGYRNVAHAPVLPCSAAYNNLCSIANSVTLVGKALDAVTRASTPWEFEGALNKMSYSDDYVIAGGFYVFAKHYSGVVVAHGAVSKFVGMTTTAIVSTVSPALDGVQFNADSTAAASQPGGSWLSYKWPTREDQVRIANGQLTNASEAAQDVKVALHMEFEFPLAGSVQQFYLAVGYNHIPRPERCADVWRDDLGQPSRAAFNCTDTAAHAAQNKCSAAFASPCAVSNTMRLVSDVATEVHVDETLDELLRKVSTSDRFAGLGQLSAPFGAVIVDSEDDGTLMSVPRFYPQNYSTLRQLYMDGFGQVGDSFDCFIRKLKRIATSQFGGSDTGLLGGWLLAPWGVVSNGTVLEVTEHALYARGFVYDSHRYFYVAGFGTRAPRPTTSFGGRPCGREHATACALSNARLAKAALLWRVLASAPENGGLSSDSSEVQADAACWTQVANSSDDGSGRRLLQAAPIRQETLNDTFTALTYANDHLLGDFSGAQVYVLRLDDSQKQACIVASTISASHVETSTCSPTIELGTILPDGTDRLAWVQAHTDAADEGQFGEHSQSFKGHSDVLVTNATGQPQLLTVTVTRVSASGDGRTYLIATGVPADLGFVSCGNGTCPKHSTCESSEQEFCECDDGYVADIDTLSCIKLESSSGGLPNWAIGVIAGLGALGIIAVGTAWLRRRHLRHKYESAWIIDPRELETVEPFTVLGRGNFGTVFLGRFRGTLVALKRVSLGSPAARSGSASVTNGSSNGEASTSSQTSSTTTVLEPAGTAKARMLKHAGSERSVLAAVQKADSGSSASTSTSSVPDGHHVASIVIGGQLGLTVEGTGSSSGIDSGSGGGSGSGGLVGGSCASLSGCLSPGGLVSDNGSAISNRGSSRGMSSSRRAHIFRKEIRLMVRLRHPHIVTVLGATKESEPLLVLEYLPRGTLRDLLLNPSSDLPANLCISMARDVCSGLRYLHDSTPAIIHGMREFSPRHRRAAAIEKGAHARSPASFAIFF